MIPDSAIEVNAGAEGGAILDGKDTNAAVAKSI